MPEIFHPILLGFLALGTFALIGWIYYINSKKPKENTDPVTKGLILSLLLIGLLFLAETIGYFDKGWNQKHFWVHLLIVFSIVSIFLTVAYRKKPLSYRKQKEIIRKYLSSEYHAEKYVGDANIHWLQVYKLTVEGRSEDTRGEVGNFLVEVKSEDTIRVWVQINVYTGHLLHIQKNPPTLLENRLLGKESPHEDHLSNQFEDGNIVNDRQNNVVG